jgi:hypothetical protein
MISPLHQRPMYGVSCRTQQAQQPHVEVRTSRSVSEPGSKESSIHDHVLSAWRLLGGGFGARAGGGHRVEGSPIPQLSCARQEESAGVLLLGSFVRQSSLEER